MNLEFTKDHYVKDIDYIPKDVPLDSRTLLNLHELTGQPGIIAGYIQSWLRTDGMQLRVEKELSDDLLESDLLNLDMDAIAWPAAAIEFYFEDPRIPTFSVCHVTGKDITERWPNAIEVGNMGPRLMIMAQTKTGQISVFNIWKEQWEDLLVKRIHTQLPGGVALTEEENAFLCDATELAIKVLAYCSLPRYKMMPMSPGDITRRMGGKLCFKNRPMRRVAGALYMPAVHTPRPKGSAVETGEPSPTRKFLGRRGYFRYFQHERYVNMKGKWIYVARIKVEGAPAVRTAIARKV